MCLGVTARRTDDRDAFVLADAARSMPHTLRSIELEDQTVTELEMTVRRSTRSGARHTSAASVPQASEVGARDVRRAQRGACVAQLASVRRASSDREPGSAW